jgi:hypothetical protein
MGSRFKFEVYDPSREEMITPANIDLLLHMDGDLQMITGDKSITGIVNVPKLFVYQRLDTLDFENKPLAEGAIVTLTSMKSGHKIICVIDWNRDNQSFELKGRYENRDIILPVTVDNIIDYQVVRIGHVKTNPDLLKEGAADGLPNS